MAKANGTGIIDPSGIGFENGDLVKILEPINDGLSWFKVTLLKQPNQPYTGKMATRFIDFEPEEIEEFGIPIDSNGLPLFRDLNVKYIGPDTAAVSKDDPLIVRELWYNSNQLECQCIHTNNSRPNTDGRVVVQCINLERSS